MKVLLTAIFLVALVALVSAGLECTKENIDKMCGPEGQAKKKEIMAKMDAECKSKLEPFVPKFEKNCKEYNSDKDLKKCCAANMKMAGEAMKVQGIMGCFGKLAG